MVSPAVTALFHAVVFLLNIQCWQQVVLGMPPLAYVYLLTMILKTCKGQQLLSNFMQFHRFLPIVVAQIIA